jgi:tetratricopeptide (TPR) repeat protein
VSASDRIDELKKRYEENPRRFFASLANEYRKAGDLEQAIALCQMHLAEQPANMNGHVVYGQALLEAGRLDEAKVTFETALTLDSENLIALRHLGDIACANGANGEAREWYGRVLDSDPRNHEIIALLAQLAKESSEAVPAAPVETEAIIEQEETVVAEPPAAAPEAAFPAEAPVHHEPPVSIPPLSERMGSMNRPEDFESSPESLVWIDTPEHEEDAASIEPVDELPIEMPSFDDGSLGAPLDAAALTPDVFGDFMPDPFADPAASAPVAWEQQAVEAAIPEMAAPEMPVPEMPVPEMVEPDMAEPPELPETPAEPAPPFVTETMAELYLQQGFTAEALEVYRQLLKADPDDEELKRRVRKLARRDRDSMPFDLVPASGTAHDTTPDTAPEAAPAPRTTARSYFAGLALRQAVRGNGSAATNGSSLDRLFLGGAVSADDEHSAHLLSQVTASAMTDAPAPAERQADSGPSLDSIFRDASARVTPTVARQSHTLRFDQFFSTAPDEAPAAPQPPSSAASSAPSGEPGSPAELKQFQSWLLGLKKQ